MLNIETLRNYLESYVQINAITPFPVELAEERTITLIPGSSLPYVTVNYHSIQSTMPTVPKIQNAYGMNEDSIAQNFEIAIFDTVQNLHKTWVLINTAILQSNPFHPEENYTPFQYAEGGVSGWEQGALKHLDIYRIAFPTINPYR